MFHRLCVALLLSVALTGCDRGPRLAEIVEGTVTLDGKPLEQVRVEFSPTTDGPNSAALTDEQGRFALATLDGKQKGAVVGKHKVVLRDLSIAIVPFRGRANEDVDMTLGKKPRISTTYANVMTTPLTVEVTGDQSDIDLAVKPYSAAEEAKPLVKGLK